jgi:hypothetical protein
MPYLAKDEIMGWRAEVAVLHSVEYGAPVQVLALGTMERSWSIADVERVESELVDGGGEMTYEVVVVVRRITAVPTAL